MGSRGVYLEFWKRILRQLTVEFKKAITTVELDVSELQQLGERERSGYNGKLELEFGRVRNFSDNVHFRDLAETLRTDYSEFKFFSIHRVYFEINGFKLTARLYKGGEETLIRQYKSIIRNGNPNEIYKWELIERFKGRPNLNTEDFGAEIKSIDYRNLIFHNASGVRNALALSSPKQYRDAFLGLFEEEKPLQQRIVDFRNEVDGLYKELGNDLQSHHDERSIATFLSFKFPENYALYKETIYSKYCRYKGLKPKQVNEKYIHYLSLLKSFIQDEILKDEELKQMVSAFKTADSYEDPNFLLLAQDILYQILDKGAEEEFAEKKDRPELIDDVVMRKEYPLNQILYGPPGTGKTYSTIEKAIAIINPTFDLTQSRAVVKAEYKRLCDIKQVEFITFHQSLSYEDFVEGIKPTLDPEGNEANELGYELKDGIFKSLCNLAKTTTEVKNTQKEVFKDAKFYKMSLGGKNRPDVHEYCLENNVIGLGYGNEKNFEEFKKLKEWNQFRDQFHVQYPELVAESKYHVQAVFIFQKMRIGDIVVVTKGNHVIDAIGRITSEYFWDDSTTTEYTQFRRVEWIAKNINQSPNLFFNKNISQQTIYEFYDADVKKEAFEHFFEAKPEEEKNYVLIIDEINRGNVSQIFGELITLLEEDKRDGRSEALEVTLPYSNHKLSVPENLYIIGTMNTADRSVEALDTALRRRFCFEEMLPKPELLSPEQMIYRLWEKYWNVDWDNEQWLNEEKDLSKLLKVPVLSDLNKAERKTLEEISEKGGGAEIFLNYTQNSEFRLDHLLNNINKRLEKLLSRDHTIGHSFFIGVTTEKQLYRAFYDKIIPLLQEYFFGDYGKIGLVLGKAFVEEVSKEKDFSFADFEYEEQDLLLEKRVYRINKFNKDGDDFLGAVKAIYLKGNPL